MINKNDLRIGNKVYHNETATVGGLFSRKVVIDDSIVTIKSIGEKCINLNPDYELIPSTNIEYEYLDGIPLTPETLEKCGFEKAEETIGGDLIFNIFTSNGSKRTFALNENAMGGYFLPLGLAMDCKSLHELQNLHRWLTGEELEINL